VEVLENGQKSEHRFAAASYHVVSSVVELPSKKPGGNPAFWVKLLLNRTYMSIIVKTGNTSVTVKLDWVVFLSILTFATAIPLV
jgi:hypothetical protein